MAAPQTYPIDRFMGAMNGWVEGDKNNTNPKARGILADLRHGLSEATQYRAWPHILRIYSKAFDIPQKKTIWLTIAGGTAMLLDGKGEKFGNMGDTLRAIALGHGKDGLASFESRFRRLLSCRLPEEVCQQLTGIFQAAKQKGVPINFRKLYWDLIHWGNP